VPTGPRKGKHYDPKVASSQLHGELGAYNPMKPLDRGEHLPSVEAYPRFDPYSKDDAAFNAFSPDAGKHHKSSKEKKSKKDKSKSKKKKANGEGIDEAGASNKGGSKEKKAKKEKKSSEKKTKAADVDGLAKSLLDAAV
jgi:AP-3 complex subunit delta-1